MSRFFPHTTVLAVLVLVWTALPGHSASGQIVLAPLRGSNAIVPDRPSTHAVDRQTAPGVAPAQRTARAAEKAKPTGRVEEGPLAHEKTPYAQHAPAFTETVPLADPSFLPVVSLHAPTLRDEEFRVLPLEADRARRPAETEAKRYRSPDDLGPDAGGTGAGAPDVIAHDNERLKR